MKTVNTQEVEKLQSSGEDFALVNVLSQESFEQAHIPSSRNVPLESDDFLNRMSDVVEGDKNKRVVVYCASESCDASTKATKKLDEAGFSNVADYEGGVDAWRNAGKKVESGSPS